MTYDRVNRRYYFHEDVLAAGDLVGHVRRLGPGRQESFPEQPAGLDVEGPEVIVPGRPDEDKPRFTEFLTRTAGGRIQRDEPAVDGPTLTRLIT